MRKHAVYTIAEMPFGRLAFYYKGYKDTYFLFYSRYRRQVHQYFQNGKSIAQLHREKSWLHKRFLTTVIEGQLRRTVRQVVKEDGYAR